MPAPAFDYPELTGLVMVPEFIAAVARGTRGAALRRRHTVLL
jgi:hypothetical protein